MKKKRKKRKTIHTHKYYHVRLLFTSKDYFDQWYFVVALIVFQVFLMYLNVFDPFELILLNVVVVMQEQI